MRKFLLAAVAVVVVSASAHAEPKRDILGFHPGMAYQEAMSAMAKICKGKIKSREGTLYFFNAPSFHVSCSLGERQVLESPYPAPPKSKMAEETLDLFFAINISERPLIQVNYLFHTSATDSDVVQSRATGR